MTHQEITNSIGYWDNRFAVDWESNSGREQSRFFARIAAEAMPQWLIHKIRWDNLTVCDWGCAQGDGTEMLVQLLSWNMTGIDFSQQAIDSAKRAYPSIPFFQENFLDNPERQPFDVLFSSNTLEHFKSPWKIFDSISRYASKFIILLIPYQEFNRHPEHETTFDASNIPIAPSAAGWLLVYQTVINAGSMKPTWWPGQQILIIYVRVEQLAAQELTLINTNEQSKFGEALISLKNELSNSHHLPEVCNADKTNLTNQLLSRERELSDARQLLEASNTDKINLTNQLLSMERELSDARQRLEVSNADKTRLTNQLISREHEINTLLATKSWRMTAPLRMIRKVPVWMRSRMRGVGRVYNRDGMRGVFRQTLAYVYRHLTGRSKGWSGLPAMMQTDVFNARAHLPAPIAPSLSINHELPDIFIFGIIDWHFRIQRPQHLAREFARAGHRVYYFSNHFNDSEEPGFLAEQLDESLPLYQVKLKVNHAPAIYFAAPSVGIVGQMCAGMQLFLNWSGANRSWGIAQHAYWYPVASRLQSDCLIYDCMDHHEGFGNVPPELLALEEKIMRRADLLVVTSSQLEKQAHRHNAHVRVIRNAGQYSDFCTAPEERFSNPDGRKIIGYYGAIAEWFDVELVARVAQTFPDMLVLLVGADSAGVGKKLANCPNIKMTGEVPYERLSYYLYSFDVCLMPFQVTSLTLATNPVKIYEYLGSGRPVVSINLPEMVQFGDLVRIADTHENFIEQIRNALTALPDNPEIIEKRKSFAADQTWTHRVADFCDAIKTLPRPKVSAIVLTYNNLDLTKNCLASLEKYNTNVDLEIIVVDNSSNDGSPDYLSAWAASRSSVKLILNNENLGFAAGNNQGLAAATGDYLVILNNDTVVTQGWAWRMVNHLRNTPDLGIIGPVTNNIGNEARVETHYASLEAMPAEARALTQRHIGQWFELDTVAFFCAMLPRSTYERCGPICEDYGRGFFEDDDYCRRIQAAGLRVGCAEDVFVHHHLSASFNKLGAERKRALFEANRKIYEAKWGPWTPHRYRKPG